MKIVHLCLCGLFGEKYAYQDNLLTKYHKKMGNEVTIIAPTASKFTSNGGVVNEYVDKLWYILFYRRKTSDVKRWIKGKILK